VATANTRAKLSYISVQIFLYQPHIPVAVGFYPSSPNSRIFAHVEVVHLHHLFPVSEGLNITNIGGGCASIPSQLQPLLLGMSDVKYLEHWQEEFLKLKAVRPQSNNNDDA
jgi:hypothetical protein